MGLSRSALSAWMGAMRHSPADAIRFSRAALAVLALWLVAGSRGEAQPAPVDSKECGVPNFWQADPRGHFANGGSDYCCPVAVSDYLVYFAGRGYGNLLPDAAAPRDPAQAQIDLINRLASRDYFGTDPREGTGPGAVLRGLRRYVEEKGYRCRRLEYEGWRKVGGAQQQAGRANLPQRDWLLGGLRDPEGAVWLNVGWYESGPEAGEWRRVGGHWVTLTGWKEGADGPVLSIRNSLVPPSPEADAAASTVRLAAAPVGTIRFPDGTSRVTAGMDSVSGPGLPMKRGRYAFLDAAIVFVIGK